MSCHRAIFEAMQDRTQVADFVTRCEKAWGINFLEGKNHNIAFMAHLWEPLRVHHKPLVVHLFSEVAGAASRLWLLMLGFRMHQHKVYRQRIVSSSVEALAIPHMFDFDVHSQHEESRMFCLYLGCTRQHNISKLSACCGRGECTGS